MKYGLKTFSVAVGGSQAFADGWERTFGAGQATPAAPLEPSSSDQVPSSAPAGSSRAYTLRCGACGHSTLIQESADLVSHRAHSCSGKKETAISAHQELKGAMSAAFLAVFPSAVIASAITH